MYEPEELELVLGKALAKWAEATGYSEPLPPVWLKEMAGMVKHYYTRLLEANAFDLESFEEDVYKLVTCFAVGFAPKPS